MTYGRFLITFIILLAGSVIVQAQNAAPPDGVKVDRLIWEGKYLTKKGLLDNVEGKTAEEARRLNYLRALHGLRVTNGSTKTITAIEWDFAIIFDQSDQLRIHDRNGALKDRSLITTSKPVTRATAFFRQDGLRLTPGESVMLAATIQEALLTDLNMLLIADGVACPDITCYMATTKVSRLEFSDKTFWQLPIHPASAIYEAAFALRKTRDDRATPDEHAQIMKMAQDGKLASRSGRSREQ